MGAVNVSRETIPAHMQSYEAFTKSIRDHSWLMDVVPGAMDVDVFIERKGRFLVVEGKPWRDGVVMPYGQHKALYALSQLPQFTVYLVGEDADKMYVAAYRGAPAPVYLKTKSCSLWPADRFTPTTKTQLKGMVRAWWDLSTVEGT